MIRLGRRLLEHFVTPAGNPWPAGHEGFVGADEAPEPAGNPWPAGPGDSVHADGAPDRACAEPAPRTPSGNSAIAVLTAAADARALGAGLGLALAQRGRGRVAMVCLWTGSQPAHATWRAPAFIAARKLATTLAARGHRARASGRLALVHITVESDHAAVQARRAIAAAGAAPTVLALGGPRTRAFEQLLAEQDLVVVALQGGADSTLAKLAVDGLADATVPACICEVPPSYAARSLAGAGLALLPSARRALAGPMQALGR